MEESIYELLDNPKPDARINVLLNNHYYTHLAKIEGVNFIGLESVVENTNNSLLKNTDLLFVVLSDEQSKIGLKWLEEVKAMSVLTVVLFIESPAIDNSESIKALTKCVDSIFVLPSASEEDIYSLLNGICSLIVNPGFIRVDFADVRVIMSAMGHAMMGYGSASGEYRASEVMQSVLSHPFLDTKKLLRAEGILVNLSAGPDLTMEEFTIISQVVEKRVAEKAIVVVGTSWDERCGDQLIVTLVATGVE